MSKKTITILLMLFTSIATFSQDRVNREKLHFDKSSDSLINATGWSYNTQIGEWIDYNNVICNDKEYKTKYSSLQGSEMMSRNNQNFISIVTKSLTFNNNKYVVLIVTKWVGNYKYPSLKEDWYTYKATYGFIFSESDFNTINTLSDSVGIITKAIVEYRKPFEDFSETLFLDMIQNQLSTTPSFGYLFSVKKTKDSLVRFLIPNIYIPSSKYLPATSDVNFSKKYFETSVDNFQKIFIK